MKCCIDCNKPVESVFAKRCIDCKKVQRKVVAKLNKDKYQYHKHPKHLYARYKRGADSRGYAFELSIEQFNLLWKQPCYYCNTVVDTIGIDRKDNTIGYVESNVVSCCRTCNFMKHTMSDTEFINKCIKIAQVFQ